MKAPRRWCSSVRKDKPLVVTLTSPARDYYYCRGAEQTVLHCGPVDCKIRWSIDGCTLGSWIHTSSWRRPQFRTSCDVPPGMQNFCRYAGFDAIINTFPHAYCGLNNNPPLHNALKDNDIYILRHNWCIYRWPLKLPPLDAYFLLDSPSENGGVAPDTIQYNTI